ncbi:MAG: hypothetical protein LUD19_01835 [Clostridia bacterium]|nr:hypothetical protein [Clostridia bacterium]
MKKLIAGLVCAATAMCCAAVFTACDTETEEGVVNLVSVTAGEIGSRSDVDYYVLPEPAASAKLKAVSGLNLVGDLQQLYGGEDGYPQAVVVAKTELLDYSVLGNFMNGLSATSDWLLSDNTSIDTIVSAVQSNLADGMSPTFSTGNLTKTVIENCGIYFTGAQDDKEEIVSFMSEFNSVSETSFGTPSDDFFFNNAIGAAIYSGTLSVYAPDGAPALGLSYLMSGEYTLSSGVEYNVEYNIVDSSVISTYVTGSSPAADICVLPVNLATKLLGSGDTYKLIGTLTHGNLYMVSYDDTQITTSNLDSLIGKTVGVVNLANVPGLTFKVILKNNGIDYSELV